MVPLFVVGDEVLWAGQVVMIAAVYIDDVTSLPYYKVIGDIFPLGYSWAGEYQIVRKGECS